MNNSNFARLLIYCFYCRNFDLRLHIASKFQFLVDIAKYKKMIWYSTTFSFLSSFLACYSSSSQIMNTFPFQIKRCKPFPKPEWQKIHHFTSKRKKAPQPHQSCPPQLQLSRPTPTTHSHSNIHMYHKCQSHTQMYSNTIFDILLVFYSQETHFLRVRQFKLSGVLRIWCGSTEIVVMARTQ